MYKAAADRIASCAVLNRQHLYIFFLHCGRCLHYIIYKMLLQELLFTFSLVQSWLSSCCCYFHPLSTQLGTQFAITSYICDARVSACGQQTDRRHHSPHASRIYNPIFYFFFWRWVDSRSSSNWHLIHLVNSCTRWCCYRPSASSFQYTATCLCLHLYSILCTYHCTAVI